MVVGEGWGVLFGWGVFGSGVFGERVRVCEGGGAGEGGLGIGDKRIFKIRYKY